MTAQITALPTPPSTNDPANFNTRADAFLGQMPTFVTQANALAGEVNNNTQAAAASVTAAANKVVEATGKASEAAASAASALNAPGTNGTSATLLTIATGIQTFTTQTGKAWIAGQGFFLASSVNPTNWMSGVLTAYNSGTGASTLSVDAVGGSGAFSAWNCGLAAGRPLAVASQAQAEAGTDNITIMTPLRVAQVGSPGLEAYFFGDGADGDITISSAVTLTRDMYYNNLTLVAGGTITTNGWRIFVKRTLDLSAAIAGAIKWDGSAGGDASGSGGGSSGANLIAGFL
ncbi:MAG TPA: hypothetical protein VN113_09225, partial [Caulobacter sp.]|nr:hypothetical protein [Caulobacter sp.]